MDITSLAVADTGFLHLKGPDDEPLFKTVDGKKLPVGITFHSPGSAPYEAAVTDRDNLSLKRGSKRGKIELKAEHLRADQIAFLAGCTVSLDNFDYPPAGGATGADLFRAVYSDRKIGWITEQATAFLGDWSNFKTASATN